MLLTIQSGRIELLQTGSIYWSVAFFMLKLVVIEFPSQAFVHVLVSDCVHVHPHMYV